MAEMIFGKGKRQNELAKLIVKNDPKLSLEMLEDGGYKVSGPYITVTRDMVEQAWFPNGAKYSKSIDRIMYGIVLKRTGKLVLQTSEKVIIGDDDGERAMTIRLRIDQQEEITKYAQELGTSRNQFVVDALEHFIQFLKESKNFSLMDEEEK